MTNERPHDDSLDARAQALLEFWFEAIDRGEHPDLAALAGGDAELASHVERMLGRHSILADTLTSNVAPDSPPPPPVDRIGDFRLLAPLGAGGMGRVFIASQEPLKRLVAVKLLNPQSLEDASARARFRREAEIAARLDHPNIVPVYGLGEEGGHAYIAMKWLSGPALDGVELPLAPREAARIAAAVARGLEEAHASGVVHRDVKPANIILDDGEPVLVDFGLARGATDVSLTQANAVPGTLPYLAPEQLSRGAPRFDPRADVYALGATLYELLTGRLPFQDGSTERLVRRIVEEAPPPLGIPGSRELQTIVLRALDKEPARRFQSAGAFSDDLERFLDDRPIVSRPSGILTRIWKLVKRRPRASMAVALSVVVAGTALGLVLWEWREKTARFESDAREATAALHSTDLPAAAAALARMQHDRPTDSETQNLAIQLEAIRVREDLIDRLMSRGDAQDEAWFADLLRRTDAIARNDPEPRIAQLALVLADLRRGEVDAATRRLDALDEDARQHAMPGRALAALRAALMSDVTVDLTPLPHGDATDALFTALALHELSRSGASQRAELEAGLAAASGRSETRLRLAMALSFIDDGDLAEAEGGLRCLDVDDASRRLVLTSLASIRLARGDPAGASAILASLPRHEEDVIAQLLEFEVRLRSEQRDAARELLQRTIEKWPRDPDVRLIAAARAFEAGDTAGAVEHARIAERSALFVRHRERAAAAAVAFRVYAVLGTGEAGPPHAPDAATDQTLRDVAGEAASLAQSFRFGAARQTARAAAALAERRLGHTIEARRLMESAAGERATNPGVQLRFADWACADASDGLITDAGERARTLRAATVAVRSVIDGGRGGSSAATFRETRDAYRLAAQAFRLLDDRPRCAATCREALDRMRSRLTDAEVSEFNEQLRWAEEP